MNIRDWIHVEDHCSAVLSTLLHGKKGESYNISANNEINNITIVQKILEIMGKSEDLIQFVEDRPGHDLRYSLDSSKISSDLNWNTKLTFEEGLKKTIDWYLNNDELMKNQSSITSNPTPWKSSN